MKKERITEQIIDIHCHILSGLDDGAADMEESLRMLAIAEQEGITHMIATPHYKENRYENSPEKIRSVLTKLQAAAKEKGIGIRLFAGSEIFYFSDMEDAAEEGKLLAMNGGSRMLVEFNPFADYKRIRNALDTVRSMGYQPIIAHAERYECLFKDMSHVEELYDMGVEIQINASSVTGEAGFRMKAFVHKLLKNQWVHYIGTDAHETKKRAPRMKKCASVLRKKYGEEYAKEVLYGNAWNNIVTE